MALTWSMCSGVEVQALRHGGRILVAHESFEYGHYGELYDTWVHGCCCMVCASLILDGDLNPAGVPCKPGQQMSGCDDITNFLLRLC
jgi:hypothetical protein